MLEAGIGLFSTLTLVCILWMEISEWGSGQ